MIARLLRNEKGSAFAVFAIFLPVLIAVMGLVIDGGNVFYNKIRLDMATEAAALSTISSYNKEIYETQGIVILDAVHGKTMAEKYLKANFPEAEIESVNVEPQNTATVYTSMTVEFHFMKIFGMKEKKINSHCKCVGG